MRTRTDAELRRAVWLSPVMVLVSALVAVGTAGEDVTYTFLGLDLPTWFPVAAGVVGVVFFGAAGLTAVRELRGRRARA